MMPATARATARRARYPAPNTEKLLDPEFNIPLGGHHIAELMQEFNSHRVLVAAALQRGERKCPSLAERGIWHGYHGVDRTNYLF